MDRKDCPTATSSLHTMGHITPQDSGPSRTPRATSRHRTVGPHARRQPHQATTQLALTHATCHITPQQWALTHAACYITPHQWTLTLATCHITTQHSGPPRSPHATSTHHLNTSLPTECVNGSGKNVKEWLNILAHTHVNERRSLPSCPLYMYVLKSLFINVGMTSFKRIGKNITKGENKYEISIN